MSPGRPRKPVRARSQTAAPIRSRKPPASMRSLPRSVIANDSHSRRPLKFQHTGAAAEVFDERGRGEDGLIAVPLDFEGNPPALGMLHISDGRDGDVVAGGQD